MAQIRTVLRGLADVEGVIGSFVVSHLGTFIDTDLPSAFDGEVFGEVGPRLVRLLETSAALGDQTRAMVVRFAGHKLYVKPMPNAVLAVLLAVNTSMPALKVAAGLVARRLDALVPQFWSEAPDANVPPAPSLPAVAPPPEAAPEPEEIAVSPSLMPPDPEAFGSTPPPLGAGSSRRPIRFRGRTMG